MISKTCGHSECPALQPKYRFGAPTLALLNSITAAHVARVSAACSETSDKASFDDICINACWFRYKIFLNIKKYL